MNTEIALLAAHRSPVIRLDAICEKHFNMSYYNANVKAARNELPIPTFRLTDSAKAPVMVHVSDLAAYIDAKAKEAKEDWLKSQV